MAVAHEDRFLRLETGGREIDHVENLRRGIDFEGDLDQGRRCMYTKLLPSRDAATTRSGWRWGSVERSKMMSSSVARTWGGASIPLCWIGRSSSRRALRTRLHVAVAFP